MKQKFVPTYEGELRKHALQIPRCISECSGIRVFGRRIKSLVFSTDVAIIKNINADAVIAVYPFTPQPSITQAIIGISEVPVFCGVGGGTTKGLRSVYMAQDAEAQGAFGVVVNNPMSNSNIRFIKRYFPQIRIHGIPKMAHAELVIVHPEEFCRYAEKFLAGPAEAAQPAGAQDRRMTR